MSSVEAVLRERYELLTQIGQGGMSSVYLARDRKLGTYWAVKQIKNNNGEEIQAFKKEAQLLAGLSHPDIPRIVDRIETDEDFFVIMDLIDGTSLRKKAKIEKVLPEESVIQWAIMICDVLDYLHTAKENPIVYGDMKPDNLMLTKTGRISLIDFGTARECVRGEKQSGTCVGTKGYAAPEQYPGGSHIFDERTDIYSLGATIFYLVTGQVPNRLPRTVLPIRQVNPMLSEGLEHIICKCTCIEPEDRYQSCQEVKADLEHIHELTASYRQNMQKKLYVFSTSVCAGILCLIVTLFGYTKVQAQNDNQYRHYYNIALSAMKGGDPEAAADHFIKAIQYRPMHVDTHLLYFDSMLPQKGEAGDIQITKNAIDTMRNMFIDNRQSDMFHNESLMYHVSKKCLEVNDALYASYAVDYIGLLNKRKYKAADLHVYEILALNCAKDVDTLDFSQFETALLQLEQMTEQGNLSADDCLYNYFVIMSMYSGYPNHLKNAYEKVCEIGMKSKAIIEQNAHSEELTFQNMIPMYEMTASNLYHSAVVQKVDKRKKKLYLSSLEWFSYLGEFNMELQEALWMKKANAYKGIFELMRSEQNTQTMDFLNKAIEEYEQIIRTYPNSFVAHINLTQVLLDKEMTNKASDRNKSFTKTMKSYEIVKRMKNNNKNLSTTQLAQFGSLKQAMYNAGLE